MKPVRFQKVITTVFCTLFLISGLMFTMNSHVFANNNAREGSSEITNHLGDAIVTWIPTGAFEMSSFERVSRELPDTLPEDNDFNLFGVRNEHVSAQLAIASANDLHDVKVEVSDLQSTDKGDVIPNQHTKVYYSSFVPNEGPGSDVIADPLHELERMNMAAGEVQPVWFNLYIPKQTAPGTYNGQITITAKGEEPVVHNFTLDVANVTLPDPDEFDIHLNLWMHPDAVAAAHNVQMWSDEHWYLLKKYMQDIASRGQKVINVAVADDPWRVPMPDGSYRAQTYTPYESLVEWRYDGTSWSFDYSLFDKYVEESLEEGVGPYIHAFGMVMFGHDHLKYTNMRTGEIEDKVVQLGGPFWKEAWSAFLPDFEQHLREKGWLEHTFLAFDERPLDSMKVAFDLLEDVAPVFLDKLAIASLSGELEPYAADVSFHYSPDLGPISSKLVNERRTNGKKTTFYTTGGPHHPNTVTHSPLIGARMLSWASAKYNFDGYLRWSYNSWPQDVFNDPSYRYLQGDEYIIYPGEDAPLSSLRWEVFRDGIEDFELIKQLRDQAGSDNATLKEALQLINPDVSPSSEVYANLLQARKMVIEELERFKGVAVSLDSERNVVQAGDVINVDATLHNKGNETLKDVTLELDVPDGWAVKAVTPNKTRAIEPSKKFRTQFELIVPNSEQEGRFVDLKATASFKRNDKQVELPLYRAIEVLDPRIIPQEQMSATATSEEQDVDPAEHAIDGDPATMWHTDWDLNDPLPQSITVDLGGAHHINEVRVLPRQTGTDNGIITQYKLYVSADGQLFTEVANGVWNIDREEKRIQFAPVEATHIKLEAIEGVGGFASVAEIDVFKEVELETHLATMMTLMEHFEQRGEFDDDRAAHSLKLHLTALSRYGEKDLPDKVVKHLKGYRLLLEHQKENGLVSETAFSVLRNDADWLIDQLLKEDVNVKLTTEHRYISGLIR